MEQILDEKILDRKRAASYLGGICLTTLSRLDIPCVKIRRRVFFRKSDLDKWLMKHTINSGGGQDE